MAEIRRRGRQTEHSPMLEPPAGAVRPFLEAGVLFPGGQTTRERMQAMIDACFEPVEPIDLQAPAATLVRVPWTTLTTDENALARTLELADAGPDRVIEGELGRPEVEGG